MIKYYKLKKKEFYETIIKGHIKYNLERAQVYKSTNVNQLINGFDFGDYPALAKSYHESVLNKLHQRYNIDSKLIQNSIITENLAIKEYDELMTKREIHIKEIETTEKVACSKKAIMELKIEGLI